MNMGESEKMTFKELAIVALAIGVIWASVLAYFMSASARISRQYSDIRIERMLDHMRQQHTRRMNQQKYRMSAYERRATLDAFIGRFPPSATD